MCRGEFIDATPFQSSQRQQQQQGGEGRSSEDGSEEGEGEQEQGGSMRAPADHANHFGKLLEAAGFTHNGGESMISGISGGGGRWKEGGQVGERVTEGESSRGCHLLCGSDWQLARSFSPPVHRRRALLGGHLHRGGLLPAAAAHGL